MNKITDPDIRNRTITSLRLFSSAILAVAFQPGTLSAQNDYHIPLLPGEVVVYQESFETPGEGDRWKVQNGTDNGTNQFFARRQIGSTGVRASGGSVDGEYVWGGRDIDGQGVPVDGLLAFEARLWLAPFSIAGYRNLRIVVATAEGEPVHEFDDMLMFEYRIEGTDDWQALGNEGVWTTPGTAGEWVQAGGFRGKHTDSPGWYFEGDFSTYPDAGTPRTTRTFRDFAWQLWGIGNTMQLRMYIKGNGATEDYIVDNIRVIGIPTTEIGTITPSLNKQSFQENEGAGTGTLTIGISPAAPAGGLTVNIITTDQDKYNLNIPESVVIPAGSSNIVVPFDIVHDNRFSGDITRYFQFEAAGYGRNQIDYFITNVDPRPRILITELHGATAGAPLIRAPWADINGDGNRNSAEDEAIEFLNLDTVAVDISGWYITDDLGKRHIFPEGTILPPGGVIIVFGGGIPMGDFGGAQLQIASTGNLGINNGGDQMRLSTNGAVVREIIVAAKMSQTLKSIVIPQNLINQLGHALDEGCRGDYLVPREGGGFNVDTAQMGKEGDRYIVYGDDQGFHPYDDMHNPAEPPAGDGTAGNPNLPKFFALGLRKDGSGLPLMNWDSNRINLSLSSSDSVPKENWPEMVTDFADLAVLEGDTVTLTIELTNSTQPSGMRIAIEVEDAASAFTAPSSTAEGNAIRATDRASRKVLLGETEVTITGTGPTTVTVQTLKLNQPDGPMVASITARALDGSGVLAGRTNLLIINTAFDAANKVIVNEILSGITQLNSDPNRNGILDEMPGDQFIELVNTGEATVNLSGWRLYSNWTGNATSEELVHIFPEGTFLNPLGAIVVFGDGDEAALQAASAEHFGGAIVQVSNVGVNGVNITEGPPQDNMVRIENRYGKIIDQVWSQSGLLAQSSSLTRNPDLTGIWSRELNTPQVNPENESETWWPWVHALVPESFFESYSAGTRVDLTPFEGSGQPVTPVAAVYNKADAYDWEGYTFANVLGILYTKEWPWSYHYDLNRWFYPLSGGPHGPGAAEGELFLYDATGNAWLFTSHEVYPAYYNFTTGAWLSF